MAAESAIGPGPLSLGIRGRRYPVLLPSLRDPRLRLTAVIWSLQVLGQTSLGFQVSIAQILLTLGTAAAIEVAIVFWQRRVIMWPASALVTANGVAFILRVPGTAHGDWWSLHGAWIFVATTAIAVLSKYVIRVRGRHIFNPSNLGLMIVFLVLGSTRTEPQYFWWGPLNVWLVLALGVIAIGALGILSSMGLLRVALGFWLAFAAGIAVLAISGHAMTARWHVGPITGLPFWGVLVTSPEVFVFLSFMITDPKTSPRTPSGRWRYAVAIGLLASLLIAPQTTEFATKVALLAALTIVCAAWPLVAWLRTTETVGAWRARIAAAMPSAPRSRLVARSGLALGVAASTAAILVAAGIPARPAAAAPQQGSLLSVSTRVSAAEIPKVTVAPSSNVVSISHTTALQIARDVIVDLRLQEGALVRRSRRLAAAGATGGALATLERQIAAAADGARPAIVQSYTVKQLRLALVPGPGQAAPLVLATLEGTVAPATYSGSPPRLVSRGAATAVAEALHLQLASGRYLIISAKGARTGAAAPVPLAPSPVEVALSPAGPSAVPLGDPFSVRVGLRLRKGQKYAKPVTVSLAVEGPGAAPVRFVHASLIVAPGSPVTHVASVTPSEWYAQPGSYRIVASVGGRTVAGPLRFSVTSPRITIPQFQDVTKASGLATSVPAPACGEFISTPAWGQIVAGGGLALFVPRLSARSQLFVQTTPGHFTDVAAASGVAVSHATAASFGDYLNDGRQDLFVARYGAPSLLFRNDGNGRFTNVTGAADIGGVGHASSATWVDYNNDGRLDLYVTNYMTCAGRWTSGTDALSRVRYFGARLFRNDGDGRFTNVSRMLPENPKGAGLAAAWFDATGDGRDDLYVGNDNVGQDPDHNRLYVNGGRTAGASFSETSASSGTALFMNTMGIAVGDFKRTGRLDFALSNIGGNQLLMNNGNGTFASAGAAMGVMRADQFGSYPSVTWGVGAYDFTDDGWQDLYFSAGNVNPRLDKLEGAQPSEMFLNDGGKRFLDVSAPSGTASAGDAKGVAFADYQRNGRVDMFVLAQDGAPHLYRNVTPLHGNHWLEVRAMGTVSNRDGCGARVLVTAGGATQLREILCAQNEQTAQFGLGSAARVSKLEIMWPSGIRQVLGGVAADRYLTVTEPRACGEGSLALGALLSAGAAVDGEPSRRGDGVRGAACAGLSWYIRWIAANTSPRGSCVSTNINVRACLRRWGTSSPARRAAAQPRQGVTVSPTVYVHGMFETVGILFQEAVRVVHRRAESLAIRLLTRTPAVVARIFTLGGAAQRLHLNRAVEAIADAEEVAEKAVGTAVSDVAAAVGPLVLLRSAKALAMRKRSLPIGAIAIGAVGVTAFVLRRAARRGRR